MDRFEVISNFKLDLKLISSNFHLNFNFPKFEVKNADIRNIFKKIFSHFAHENLKDINPLSPGQILEKKTSRISSLSVMEKFIYRGGKSLS